MRQSLPRYSEVPNARSGKTFIIVYALIVRACKVRSRHAIVRLHFNAVKRSVFLDTFPRVMSICFPDLKVRYNKTDYICYFPNGSEIHFVGLDEGPRTEKLLGLEFSTLYFNEASEVDYGSIQLVISRLAEKNSLKKKIYFDFNPPSKASWSYYFFIKKLDPSDDVPLDNPNLYDSLRMNPSDNLENIDSEYLSLLEKMPERERNRFLHGEFAESSGGQSYYEFKRESHVSETKIQPGTLWIGMDFNYNPFCAVICQVLNDKFFIHDEIYLENCDTYRMCSELKKRGYAGGHVIPDSTGGARKTSGRTDFEILRENNFTVVSTLNPLQFDRVNNVNRLLSSNRIRIDPKCKKLINDLEKVVWKDNKLDQSGANKLLTHATDALGYICWKLDPFGKTIQKYSNMPR